MASNNQEREEERWERARKARQWDEDRIKHFEEDQRRKREWINFTEIAEWFSELHGPAKPKKAAAARDRAYKMLEQDLLAGNFEEGGRSQVLFRCPGVSSTHARMTRQRLQNVIDSNLDGEHGRFYLKHCWLPRKLFERWRVAPPAKITTAFPTFAREPWPRFAKRRGAFARTPDTCANVSSAASVEACNQYC